MKCWIVDAETTIRNRGECAIGDMAASPHCSINKIVLLGERQSGINTIWDTVPAHTPHFMAAAKKEKVLLVGQNIGFDLKYIAKTWDMTWPLIRKNIFIWDTQQVAYLLSAQTHMYPSLDQLCTEIGRPLKDDKIKEYWDNGVDTDMIPRSELQPYLEGDLENTDAVFRYQYEIVRHIPALFNLVKVKMDDLLCTIMMEENGMQFDLVRAQHLASGNDMTLAYAGGMAKSIASHFFHAEFEFNPMSNDHVSLAMFGGKYTVRQPVPAQDKDGNEMRYKTGYKAGRVKTRLEDVEYTTKGMEIIPPATAELKKGGIYSVADEVLQKYNDVPFVRCIQQIREMTKENETYYRGYSALVWPNNRIHPSINHCSTRTGRQSCNKPNLQNVTRD